MFGRVRSITTGFVLVPAVLLAGAASSSAMGHTSGSAPRVAADLPPQCAQDATYLVTCTYTVAGDYSLTLPTVASGLDITAVGGSGGGANGGKGALVRAYRGQVFGQTLTITVGSNGTSPGGTRGGGAGGAPNTTGGGGGASLVTGKAQSSFPVGALVVAGGGGGAGGGGVAGGNAGSDGAVGANPGSGGAGTQGTIVTHVNPRGGNGGPAGQPGTCDDSAAGTAGQTVTNSSVGGVGGAGGVSAAHSGNGGGGGGGGYGPGGGGGGGAICGVIDPHSGIEHWTPGDGGGGGGGKSFVDPSANFERPQILEGGSAPGGTPEVVISYRIPMPDACSAPDPATRLVTCAFSTAGAYQVQIPAGASNLNVIAAGGEGGTNLSGNVTLHPSDYGGTGALVSAGFGSTLDGTTVTATAGGRGGDGGPGASGSGGFGGGGSAGSAAGGGTGGAGGGGASSLGALLVAGGGGGAGGYYNPNGRIDGGYAGTPGFGANTACASGAGGGGSTSTPPAPGGNGAAVTPGQGGAAGGAGGNGVANSGGAGGGAGKSGSFVAGSGGGGGGGAVGGGGGGGGAYCSVTTGVLTGGGGGGGGSSSVDPSATTPAIVDGGAAPNDSWGWIVITYTAPPVKNLIKDGSFEKPVTPGSAELTAGETIGPWLVATGSVDLTNNYWQNAGGAQSLDLAGSEPGGVSQTVTLPVTGGYAARFHYAGNSECGKVSKHLLVTADAPTWGSAVTLTKKFDTSDTSDVDMQWKSAKLTFNGTVGDVVTLSFNDESGTACGATLDTVTLKAQ